MKGSALARPITLAIGGLAALLAVAMMVSTLVAITVHQSNCATDVPPGAGPVSVANFGVLAGIRIASWNTYARNSTGRIAAGIASIGRTADVIGVQELNPKSRREAVARALPGFGVSEGNNSVQIFWRKSTVDLIAQGSNKVFDVERIESGVAGTSIGPKSIQWVQLRQKATGAVFFVVNHHIIPSIENGRRPDDRKPRRLALYHRQMAAMVKLVAKLRSIGPVMVTGDFNIDARADAQRQDPRWPYVQLGRLGMWSSWRALEAPASGTHGRRLIDYVWVTMATARPAVQSILGKYGSDHSAVVVSFNGTAAPKAASSPSPTPPPSTGADIQNQLQNRRRASSGTGAVPTVMGLTDQQMKIAETAYVTTLQVAREKGWSALATDYAAVIALSTAMKESDLLAYPPSHRPDRNGDMGLFGQRIKTGWYATATTPEGRRRQVLDPIYGTRAFLLGVRVTEAAIAQARREGTEPAGERPGYMITGLVQVKGWENLSVSVAQHRVQRSAFPNMPALKETIGRALVAAFKKRIDPNAAAPAGTPAGDPCLPDQQDVATNDTALDCPATDMAGERGLKPSALYALRCVADKFPQIKTIGGYYQTNAGEHPLYRAIDIMIPNWQDADGIALGTQIAEWVRTNHKQMNVMYVVWRKKIWNVQRNQEGWRQCGTPVASCYSGPDPSAAHLNHVHVSVYPGNPPGFSKAVKTVGGDSGPDLPAGATSWLMPMTKGSYRVGCSITCRRGHTGQDFPAAGGTNLVSATAGTVVRSEALRDRSGNFRSYGNLIVIRPAGQASTEIYYAHLSSRDVQTRQTVQAGQHIGRVGSTGNSSGPHLHFEIRVGGSPRDPMPILRQQGVRP